MSVRKIIHDLIRPFERDFVTHNRIEVSRAALLHNVDLFAKLSGQKMIPVLKANAYGHGIEQVVKALEGRRFPYVAVDAYFEALRVRELSDQPVLIMGAILPENFARMKYDDFAFVVHDEATVHALGQTGKKIPVHLECNTGMNRYGAKMEELEKLVLLILSYENLRLEGVMSHLADSDAEDPHSVKEEVEAFDACVELVMALGAKPSLIHVGQSAGSLKVRSKHANVIRLGIGLYGINPFPKRHRLHPYLRNLRPALKLMSSISKVIELHKGDRVGYNYTFTARRVMKIGVLPLGYYEGLNRALSNEGVVKIGDQFAPIVGKICMNHTMIDLSEVDAKEGDEVIVYSDDPQDKNSLDAIAHEHRLFNYNLLTALSADVRRVLS